MNTTPERMTKSEFARHMGWSATRVSQLAKEHRLVLDGDDLVIVERSKALIRATRKSATQGGDRTGKHARLAAERAAATALETGTVPRETKSDPSPPVPAGAEPAATSALNAVSLTEAARLEKLERVRGLRLENDTKAGTLVRRDEVEAEAFRRARLAQEALMALKDRLVPLLAIESDERAIDTMLDTEFRHVLAHVAIATPDES